MAGVNFMVIAGFVVALAATWPLVLQLTASPVRHRFPRMAAKRLGLVIGYVAMLAAAAVALPAALYLIALLASIGMVYERWRARSGFGRTTGLPPGSIGLMPSGPLRDRIFHMKQFRRFGPVFKTSELLHPCVCILGHERGLRLLRQHDESLNGIPERFDRDLPGGFLRYLAPARHAHYRNMIRPALTSEVIGQAQPHIAAEARRALDRLAEACRSSDARTADPDPHIRDMMLAILVRVFFDVERESAEFAWLNRRYDAIDIRRFKIWGDGKRRAATLDLTAFAARRAAAFASEASGRHARSFLEALAAANPLAADDPTVLGNLVYMVEVGRIDTGDLLRWLIKMLADHPGWIERVRAESGDGAAVPDGRRAADRVVLETLRLAQSEVLYRRTTREIWFDGYRIPKNWTVRICIREGHRDPDVFADPDVFDPDRFLKRDFPHSHYAPFGLFRHTCMGAQLVHAIGGTFVIELARRFDLSAGEDWPIENSNFHWEPRRRHRIELRVRDDDPARQRLPDAIVPTVRLSGTDR